MSTRPVLCGVPTVEVNMARYDELLHKEALLGDIEKIYNRMPEYAFRDAVGYLLKSAPVEAKADE